MTAAVSIAAAAVVVGAYFVGCFSPSYLLARRLRGEDIRAVGSGNPGATNVLRTLGKGAAVVVLLLDVAKGALPVLVARTLELSHAVVAAAAFAAVLGHVFSVFLGFRGGKGVATAVGAFGALDLWALVAALGAFLIVVAWTRYVSLGSVVMVLLFPLFVVAHGRFASSALDAGAPPRVWAAAALAIAALVVYRHRSNLGNLVRGCERRLGERSAEEAG